MILMHVCSPPISWFDQSWRAAPGRYEPESTLTNKSTVDNDLVNKIVLSRKFHGGKPSNAAGISRAKKQTRPALCGAGRVGNWLRG